ncbi:hypothetical protein GQ42DRAFT_178469, partial [Ramicandelaber brevisporus]
MMTCPTPYCWPILRLATASPSHAGTATDSRMLSAARLSATSPTSSTSRCLACLRSLAWLGSLPSMPAPPRLQTCTRMCAVLWDSHRRTSSHTCSCTPTTARWSRSLISQLLNQMCFLHQTACLIYRLVMSSLRCHHMTDWLGTCHRLTNGLQLFRLAFQSSPNSISVIILDSNTGSRMASLLSSNLRAKTLIQDGEVRATVLRGPPSDPLLKSGRLAAAIIAGSLLLLLGIIARFLYTKVLLGRTALTRKEGSVIVAAVQHALELWHQSVLERRARIRATMPKPIKPDLSDIATVVLDKFNMAAVLTRTATVQSPLAVTAAPTPAPVSAPNHEHDTDIDIDTDGYDDEGHASPLAHARHLVRRNADTD